MLWLLPPLILERLPSRCMNGIIGPCWRCGVSDMVREDVTWVGFPIAVASWGVVAKRLARNIFPVNNCRWYMNTPQASGDRLVRLLCKPPEKIGDPTFFLYGLVLQVLHTFTKGLLQGTGVTHTGSLCLHDGNCTHRLCISDHGFAVGLCLFDGLGSLGLILMQGSFSMRYQTSLVGVLGSPSCEQPPHGHIHFPLQSKYLL